MILVSVRVQGPRHRVLLRLDMRDTKLVGDVALGRYDETTGQLTMASKDRRERSGHLLEVTRPEPEMKQKISKPKPKFVLWLCFENSGGGVENSVVAISPFSCTVTSSRPVERCLGGPHSNSNNRTECGLTYINISSHVNTAYESLLL